jgi:iron complex outermembrane receptor protein
MRKALLLFVLGVSLRAFSQGEMAVTSQWSVSSQEIPTGTISGQIKTTDSKAAPYVTIFLKGTSRYSITDENGLFVIKNIKEGVYTLEVSMVGLKTVEKSVEVKKDQHIEVSLSLEEDAKQLADVIVTVGKGLNDKRVSVGKISIDPMDLPQSILVISQGTIRDQQAQRLSDLIRNVNGIYLSSTRGSTQENFSARGYGLSNSNMFKDGVRINSGAMPEIGSVEKLEVLKGSAAILYGLVSPGGVINMVTKQPKFERGMELSFRTGSYDLYKPTVDIYGPLSGSIAYRIHGSYETQGSFRDVVSSKRYYIDPSLLFNLSDRTQLILQADYLNHKFTPDFGIGTYDNTKIPNVPIHNFYGTPWQYAKTQQTSATASLKHKINNDWTLNASTSYQQYQRDYYSTERIQALANGDWARPLNKTKTKDEYYIAQAYLTGKFTSGSLGHTILTGIDADRYLTRTNSYNQPAIYDTINLFDAGKFRPRTDIPDVQDVRLISTPVNRFGVYVQDLVSLSDKIKILAGVRWSYQNAAPVDTLTYANSVHTQGAKHKIDNAFSPRLGMVYKPLNTTSLFASYSNSFSVNTGTDVYGNALSPSIIDQYEAGVKNDFFKGKLSANLTIYRIVNNNLAQTAMFAADGVTPNNNTNLKALTGQTTSDGVELDLSSHPIKGIDITAGYSYNYIRYTKTPDTKGSFIEGERLINNPASTGNASVFYTLEMGMLKGLRLGGSLFYTGTRYAGFNNTKGQTQTYKRNFEVSGFTTVELNAGYTYKKVSLIAKLSNFTNTLNYYVHENYSVNPIPPRQIIVTASIKL